MDVGTDYGLYVFSYHEVSTSFWSYYLQNSPQETGFTLGILGMRTLTDDPRILFMVSSAVTVTCAAVAMRRLSVNFAVSLTLYVLLGFYLAPLNIVRQGLAISLNFLAYSYLDKHKGRWLALNVLAQFMHSSTVIAVVLQLLVRRVKPTWGRFAAMLLVTALIAVSLATIAPQLTFLNLLNERYLTYLADQQAGIGTYLYLLSRLFLVAMLMVYRPRNGEIDRYIMLSMVGVCLLLLGTQAEAIGRLELYFCIYLVVALPRAAREVPRRSRATRLRCGRPERVALLRRLPEPVRGPRPVPLRLGARWASREWGSRDDVLEDRTQPAGQGAAAPPDLVGAEARACA